MDCILENKAGVVKDEKKIVLKLIKITLKVILCLLH